MPQTAIRKTRMKEISMLEFLSNSGKYFDYAKKDPVSINMGKGERFTIVYNFPEPQESKGRMATPEEIEMFRKADEEYARGEYYKKLPGETWEKFFERIDADPENELECNRQYQEN